MKIKPYRTIALPAVYYGCETWSLTLREEHESRALEKRLPRKVFASERDEVTGELHNDLYDLYSSPNIRMKNEMGGACGTYGRGGVHTGFWWGDLKERDSLEDLGIDGG